MSDDTTAWLTSTLRAMEQVAPDNALTGAMRQEQLERLPWYLTTWHYRCLYEHKDMRYQTSDAALRALQDWYDDADNFFPGPVVNELTGERIEWTRIWDREAPHVDS